MIEGSSASPGLRRYSRRLMVIGVAFWGLGVSGALAPRVVHAIAYPAASEGPRFSAVAAEPLGASLLWAALVAWSISWACVVGFLAASWAARQGRPGWASPALLLLSFVSPLVFGFALSFLLGLATRDAYHANGIIPFLPAVVLQLVISEIYSFVTGLHPRAGVRQTEGA